MTETTKPPAPKEEGARSFTVLLSQIAQGAALDEATNELHELITYLKFQAMNRGPKGEAKGKLTLQLAVTVVASGHVGIKYDVTTKEPKPDRSDDIFWLTPGGNLSRNNPHQQSLFPRDVSREPVPMDVADDETSVAREAQ